MQTTITVKFNDKTKNIPKDTLEKIPFFKDALKFESEKEIIVRWDHFVFQAMLATIEDNSFRIDKQVAILGDFCGIKIDNPVLKSSNCKISNCNNIVLEGNY